MATTSKRARREAASRAAGGHRDEAERVPQAALMAVDGRTAARRIRDCISSCGEPDLLGAVHPLMRAVRRGARTPRRAAVLSAAVGDCLEEAARAGRHRWAVAEAAAWALARLARSGRRQADATGVHLERLVAEARAGAGALAERDTRPARFSVVLSRLFADVEACRELQDAAVAAVVEEVGRLVTGDGAVVLGDSTATIDRVDRWTGVRWALGESGGHGWDQETERRWRAAAAWSLRLLGARGRLLADGDVARTARPLVTALAALDGGRSRRTARLVRRGTAPSTRPGRLLPTDHHDGAAAVTVIRTGWGPDAVRVLLEWRDTAPRIEIAAGDRLLATGAWEWAVTSAGRTLDAEGAWTVSAWEADRKAAFLELTAPLSGGSRLERQVVVLRRQRVVLLADAVVTSAGPDGGDGAGEISLRTTLPLARRLAAEPAAETREVLAYDDAMRLMALPLALPEWRTAGRGGLVVESGRLVLDQHGHRRLYAPLWLDCDPRRIGRPLTWRQLTVADTRRNLPTHQAAGFRVQVGAEQWLLYRALDASRNRTLLGCNVSSGFLLGRVKRSGEVARTVEIE